MKKHDHSPRLIPAPISLIVTGLCVSILLQQGGLTLLAVGPNDTPVTPDIPDTSNTTLDTPPIATSRQTSNVSGADQALANGWQAYDRGDLPQAADLWREARTLYEQAGQIDRQIDSLRYTAAAFRSLGSYRLAQDSLSQAVKLAQQEQDDLRLMLVLEDLGVLATLTRDAVAYDYLQKSLELAQKHNDMRSEASILNNFGNHYTVAIQFQEALDSYLESSRLAREVGDDTLLAQSLVNAAAAARGCQQETLAHEQLVRAYEVVRSLPATHDHGFLLVSIGQALLNERKVEAKSATADVRSSHKAFEALTDAMKVAKQLNDQALACYALEAMAKLYRQNGQLNDALSLTQRGATLADKSGLSRVAYRLEWLRGWVLNEIGHPDESIAAYAEAVRHAVAVQSQTVLGMGNRYETQGDYSSTNSGDNPGDNLRPLFWQYADLLLQQAITETAHDESQKLMRLAINTLEQLKTAELADYFQDQCIHQLSIETLQGNLAADTAVIYLVLLEDRTEILIDMQDGIRRYTAPVDRATLVKEVQLFRDELVDESTRRHLHQARQLYDWLIAPIDKVLQSKGIDTLVFVPDGPLRSIPMAALHDGQQFLIERYAMAVTPGMTLTDPRPLEQVQVHLLGAGLTHDSDKKGEPLPYVQEEIDKITRLFSESKKILNEHFTSNGIEEQVRDTPYSIVHIASHANFGSRPSDTFIKAYDSHLTLTDLQRMVGMARFRDQPIELLTLSACETAAGDDRAALGLAGVAIKAGARSALATLWPVIDQTTPLLMSEFYQQIRDHPGLSKAKALQRAQVKLLQKHSDPKFWSPFLIIGNWR